MILVKCDFCGQIVGATYRQLRVYQHDTDGLEANWDICDDCYRMHIESHPPPNGLPIPAAY